MGREHVKHLSVMLSVAIALGIVSYGSYGSFAQAFIVAIVAGLIAAPFLARLDADAGKRLRELGLADGDYPARISVVATIKGDPVSVLDLCQEGVRALPNFGSVEYLEPGARLRAKTRRTRISWGEVIDIEVKRVGELSQLQVRSEPKLWTVTEDLRCNFQNVALLLRHVHHKLPVIATVPEQYLTVITSEDRSDVDQS